MNTELISLIVPYYKTSAHQVMCCVQSILNQSYENVEILVVDDGSGEEYHSILRDIEKLDHKVRVIYKEKNEGLSATRNFGLLKASGDYVMFIDSDDMIHPSALSHMMFAMKETRSDMVIGELAIINEYGKANRVQNDKHNYEVMDQVTAIDRLLRLDGFGSTACGRLAHKRIWHRNGSPPFIEGILHEDLASMWEIIDNCDMVCLVKGEYYYYYQGGESNIHTRVVSDRFCFDFYKGLVDRNNTLVARYPELKESIAYSYLINIPLIYTFSYETENPKAHKAFRRTLLSLYRSNYRMGMKSPRISKKNVIRYSVFMFCPPLYIMIYKYVRRKRGLRI